MIGVDCSTTGSKAVAFAEDGSALAEARRPVARTSPHPGWQEQDPEEWWTATAGALAELAGGLRGRRLEPAALALTHQRETFACLDEDGHALRPGVLWLDSRAKEQIARLGSTEVHARSGKPPSVTPSLYKLAWLAEHEPDVLRRADLVVDVHGLLVGRLTGERATSWASADPMALLDMATLTWAPELLELAGLDVAQLPRLVAPGDPIGVVTGAAAAATGLPAGLPVIAGAGDGQCAGLGAAVTSPDEAYLNLGTGLTMGTHSDAYAWARPFRTLASPIAGAYTIEALLSSGALSIAWVRDLLAGPDPAGGLREPQLEALAAGLPPGARGLLYLPYLTSAESPHWDVDARGAFVGLAADHGPAELYRAVLEGLACEERLTLELVEEATARRVERLVAMGGASRSPLFTQMLADVLERPVALCAETETTALGAAVLAAAAVGLGGTHGVVQTARRMARTAGEREPDPAAAARYAPVAAAHRELYPALRPTFGRLAALRRESAAALSP